MAVDQTRLRRITEAVLHDEELSRADAATILTIAQLAAGVDPAADPVEHAALQAVAQRIGGIVGLKPGELLALPLLDDEEARRASIGVLASQLDTPATRELAFVFAFVVSVADAALIPAEIAVLETVQRALGVDDRRATDLIIVVTEAMSDDGDRPEPRTGIA